MLAIALSAALAATAPIAAPAANKPKPAGGPAVPAANLKDAHPLLPVLCDTMRAVLAVLDPPGAAAGNASRPSLITYDVAESRGWSLNAGFGAIEGDSDGHDVRATVRMRVGDSKLDNTHHVPNDRSEGMRIQGASSTLTLPLGAPPALIRRMLEDETDKRFARAASDLGAVNAARAVASAAEDTSDDLAEADPQVSIPALGSFEFDPGPWRDRLRRITAVFRGHGSLLGGDAWLRVTDEIRMLVTSEGSVIQRRSTRLYLGVTAWTRTADGEDLQLQWDVFSPDLAGLPSEEQAVARATALAARVEALRAAPAAEPYVGPMLVAGRAAGVLFHEVLGHPLEGERQRAEEQSQTFKGKIGERILPDFLDITFDPSLRTLGGVPLAGAYDFDDEGVKGQRVRAVEKGVLRSFLLSRRPITGFPRSNGHGRTEGVQMPVARQSNLLVGASATVPEPELRKLLVDRARARGLAYGLYVAEVERGATRTARGEPNAFNVVPVEVYRVPVDGKPDELIRGAELIGTPLAALLKIAAAGDTVATFNGVCGAESGWVPVSASSPMLLLDEIEVQRAAKSSEREPVLPAPDAPQPLPGKGAGAAR